jgi:hypothetical protein
MNVNFNEIVSQKNRIWIDGKSLGQQTQQNSDILLNQRDSARVLSFRGIFAMHDCSSDQNQR